MTTTENTETIHDLYIALVQAGADVDWAESTFDLTDEIKVWTGPEHTLYRLVADALDEDQNPWPGFQWSMYEVLGDEQEDDSIGGEGYAETVAEAVADLTR